MFSCFGQYVLSFTPFLSSTSQRGRGQCKFMWGLTEEIFFTEEMLWGHIKVEALGSYVYYNTL